MTHVHVCCARAHASHICINQKAGGEIWSIQSWWCVKGQEDLQLEAFTCISIIRSAVTAGAQTGASAELSSRVVALLPPPRSAEEPAGAAVC